MSTLGIKLVSLVVKQLSKPFANSLAQVVLANNTLRTSTVYLARQAHKFNVYVRYYGEGDKKRFVAEITDDKAINLASTMVTETVLYGIAASTVYYEWQRGVQASEAKKQQERQARMDWEIAAEAQRKLLTEQNEKQYQVIYSVRDRLIALEAEVDELKGARQQGWFKRGQRAQAADDHGDARHDKLD